MVIPRTPEPEPVVIIKKEEDDDQKDALFFKRLIYEAKVTGLIDNAIDSQPKRQKVSHADSNDLSVKKEN